MKQEELFEINLVAVYGCRLTSAASSRCYYDRKLQPSLKLVQYLPTSCTAEVHDAVENIGFKIPYPITEYLVPVPYKLNRRARLKAAEPIEMELHWIDYLLLPFVIYIISYHIQLYYVRFNFNY